MWVFASVLNRIFGIILAPFRAMHPAVGLLVVSVLTGVVMLLIFGKTSNQDAIRRAKGRLKAHIAEIWLFRDDLLQMILAVVRVLVHTGRYFAHSLRPLVFILLPVLIIMVMLGVRYEHRPLRPGETAILVAMLDDATWARGEQVRLVGTTGVEVASPPLRIPSQGEINWKIRATAPGMHELTLETPQGSVTKMVPVADEGSRPTPLATARGRAFSSRFLFFPVEPPLSPTGGVQGIDIPDWPHRDLRVFGLGVHWLVMFFVISLAAGFAVKGFFNVEV